MSEEGGCKSLYVGNLDPRVTDYMLTEIFATCGMVLGVKIIPDKNVRSIILTSATISMCLTLQIVYTWGAELWLCRVSRSSVR
jgi:RNA recognition motif-containing protein